ncbi:IS3 family transposase [Paenibacillus amylolyticus]|uniref:IS3 family transposase n=1 Tax=Paenibacillus amylolyticus TaxID=1451 RepID=A0ABD8ASX3_PAEAM
MEKAATYGDIQKLCYVFGVSPREVYAYLKCKRIDPDVMAKRQVLQTYQRDEGKYGYRQLQLSLWQDHGIWMSHKEMLRIMQTFGI